MDFKQEVLMNKKLIEKYIKYLNDAIKREEDPNEADTLEIKRNALTDILFDHNVYSALEKLALTCPDEEVIEEHECLGAQDGFSCFCCEQCWKRILNI